MCEAAVRSQNLQLLQWLIAQGCPYNEQQLLKIAAESCSSSSGVELLAWLRQRTTSPNDVLRGISKSDSFLCPPFLHSESSWDEAARSTLNKNMRLELRYCSD